HAALAGGLAFPAVGALFWAVLALMSGPPKPAAGRSGAWTAAPVLALSAAALLYAFQVFYPVTAAASAARRGLDAGWAMEQNRQQWIFRYGNVRRLDRAKIAQVLRAEVLPSLEKALQSDPDNAWLHLQQANWLGSLWAADRANREA